MAVSLLIDEGATEMEPKSVRRGYLLRRTMLASSEKEVLQSKGNIMKTQTRALIASLSGYVTIETRHDGVSVLQRVYAAEPVGTPAS